MLSRMQELANSIIKQTEHDEERDVIPFTPEIADDARQLAQLVRGIPTATMAVSGRVMRPLVGILARQSALFMVQPLPDDVYEISVRADIADRVKRLAGALERK